MMKNKYSKWLLVVVIGMGVAIGGYWNYSSIAIGGTSDNGMWKANYKKNSDETVGGWIGHLQQKSGGKVKIKEVSFTDNGKIVVEHKGFTEGKSEDGSVTKLNPLSTDFFIWVILQKKSMCTSCILHGRKKDSPRQILFF
ncbi:hypothetical protein [Peribacillus sp. AS_2]|uniref:hypothetical protein n=1 Tax=Peribacillus sp. AS_2 TaxID=2996755 RepID=UPI0022A6EFDA|nr:hypothetical protein [Peribacillus sp. AS_2]MCZ0875604.1 hypothetical protein [Peribacillus sp. AS_2]